MEELAITRIRELFFPPIEIKSSFFSSEKSRECEEKRS